MKHLLKILLLLLLASVSWAQSVSQGGTYRNVNNDGTWFDEQPASGTLTCTSVTYGTTTTVNFTVVLVGPGQVEYRKLDTNNNQVQYQYGARTATWTLAVGEKFQAAAYYQSQGGQAGNVYQGQWTPQGGYNWQTLVTGSLTGPVNNKLRLKYDNTAGVATMQLVVMKDGQQYGSVFEVAPGTLWSTTLENVPDGSYTLLTKVKDWVQSEAGTWTQSVGGAQLVSSTPVPSTSINGAPTDAQVVQPPTAAPPAVPSAVSPTAAGVWRTPAGNVTTDGLTNAVFREGIDKVTERQDKQIAADKKRADSEAADKTVFDEQKTSAFQQSRAFAKESEYKTSLENAMKGGGVTLQQPASSVSSIWNMTISGVTVTLFPTGNVKLALNIIRLLIQSIFVYAWITYMARECREVMGKVGTTPQARGNTLLGSGGQITAFSAAVVLVIILMGVPVAIGALADNGIGWRTTVNLFEAFTSGGSVGQGAFELISEAFPVLTFCMIANNMIFFKVFGTVIMGAAMALTRMIVPAIVLGLVLASSSEAEAAISFRNASSTAVDVYQVSGTWTVNVAGTSTASLAPQGGSAYRVVAADGSERLFEALDEAQVCVLPDGSVQVAHPSSAWLVYLWRGFVVGCLWNLGGLGIRLMSRIGGSVEMP